MLGLFVMMVGACIVSPIIVIHRCRVPSKLIWGRGIILITIGTNIGLIWLTSFPDDWPNLSTHLILFIISLVFSTIATAIIHAIKRKAEIKEFYRKQEIEKTLAKFKEHGGPKRPDEPYVSQPSWRRKGVGLGSGTPTDTIIKQGQGYHGMPLP